MDMPQTARESLGMRALAASWQVRRLPYKDTLAKPAPHARCFGRSGTPPLRQTPAGQRARMYQPLRQTGGTGIAGRPGVMDAQV